MTVCVKMSIIPIILGLIEKSVGRSREKFVKKHYICTLNNGDVLVLTASDIGK